METAYEAAHSGAILVDRSMVGYLRFRGETRLDLINRMSTQKLLELKRGEGAATVLTSDIGRIIDRLILFVDEDLVYCLTGENNSDSIARYLMRYVFFMDDFQVEDISNDKAVVGIYGIEAQRKLGELLGFQVETPLYHWFEGEITGIPVSVHRIDSVAGGGYLVICRSESKSEIWDVLASSGIVPANDDAYDYLRIESGRPRFGRELTLEYIPLEAGLRADISFNKGCYTGQEIIARMDSRGRLAKKLVSLLPEAPVEAGVELKVGERRAGSITSAADGPIGPLAMGFVKSSVLEEHSILKAGSTSVALSDPAGF
jgi:aminomethyltransferase